MHHYEPESQNFSPHPAKKPLSPLCGLVIYIIAMIVLFFLAFPLQKTFLMTGVAMTQIIILLLALLPALLLRQPLKHVFPIHRPKLRDIGGTILLWIAFWCIAIAASNLILFFFPTEMQATSDGMNHLFQSVPFAITFLIVAILPAICEEALFRGMIQYTAKKMHWFLRMLFIGILFGIFHMDPLRMVPTGILGMGLAFVMMKSNNLFLPMCFHFLNNALSTVASALVNTDTSAQMATAASSLSNNFFSILPGILLLLCFAPPAILGGSILLEPLQPYQKGRFAHKQPQILVTTIVTGILILLFFSSILFSSAMLTKTLRTFSMQ